MGSPSEGHSSGDVSLLSHLQEKAETKTKTVTNHDEERKRTQTNGVRKVKCR